MRGEDIARVCESMKVGEIEEPPVGLEPTTCALRMRRSADVTPCRDNHLRESPRSAGIKTGSLFLTSPHPSAPESHGQDAALARVVAAWPELPEPIRRAILALIDSAAPAGSDTEQSAAGAHADQTAEPPAQPQPSDTSLSTPAEVSPGSRPAGRARRAGRRKKPEP